MAETDKPTNIFALIANADPVFVDALYEGLRPPAGAHETQAGAATREAKLVTIFNVLGKTDPALLDVIFDGLKPWTTAANDGPAKSAAAPRTLPAEENVFAQVANADPKVFAAITEGLRPWVQSMYPDAPAFKSAPKPDRT